MIVFLYISAPTILVLTYMFFQSNSFGSDHYFHIDVIRRIKKNQNKFLKDYLVSVNEKYPYYPQLYHWALSFLNKEFLNNNIKTICCSIKVFEIISFNIFLFYLNRFFHWEDIFYFYSNIVFNMFPFSYSFWNAKNTGLSARGIGLVFGQIYLYVLTLYILNDSSCFYITLAAIVFIGTILSQFLFQFLLLNTFIVGLFFSMHEILILPIISLALFFLISPKVFSNFIKGQSNLKRNYFLFMNRISILKYRPSIYRDFIYDFWINLNKNFKKGVFYIYKNPIVELLYGFSFLWAVLFVLDFQKLGLAGEIMLKLVFISLFLFVITSTKWTRSLGEPQRYVEFSIPFISIIFSLLFGKEIILQLILLNSFFIVVPTFFIKKQFNNELENVNKIINELLKIKNVEGEIILSNDEQLLKIIGGKLGSGNICKPDYSRFYSKQEDFFKHYYNYDMSQISPYAIQNFILQYNAQIIIINNSIYDHTLLSGKFPKTVFKILKNVEIYTILKVK